MGTVFWGIRLTDNVFCLGAGNITISYYTFKVNLTAFLCLNVCDYWLIIEVVEIIFDAVLEDSEMKLSVPSTLLSTEEPGIWIHHLVGIFRWQLEKDKRNHTTLVVKVWCQKVFILIKHLFLTYKYSCLTFWKSVKIDGNNYL